MKKTDRVFEYLVSLQKEHGLNTKKRNTGFDIHDIGFDMLALCSAGFSSSEARSFLDGKMNEKELIEVIKKGEARDVSFQELYNYGCISFEELKKRLLKDLFFVSSLSSDELRKDLSWFRIFLSRTLKRPLIGCSSDKYLNLAFDLYDLNPVAILHGCTIKYEANVFNSLYVFENVVRSLAKCNKLFVMDFVSGDVAERYKIENDDSYMQEVFEAYRCLDAIEKGKDYSKESYSTLISMLGRFKVNLVLSNFRKLMGSSLNLKSYMCSKFGTYVGRYVKTFFKEKTVESFERFCVVFNTYYPELFVDSKKILKGISEDPDLVFSLFDLKGKWNCCEYLYGVPLRYLIRDAYNNPIKEYLGITNYEELYAFKNIFTSIDDFVFFLSEVRNVGGKGTQILKTLLTERCTDGIFGRVYPENIDFTAFITSKAATSLKKRYVISYKKVLELMESFDEYDEYKEYFDGELDTVDLNTICYLVNKSEWVK